MKQRIRVTAICEENGKILLLKRATGRVEGMDYYELPTGKIIFGEQPDEAMVRVVYENLAVQVEEVKLEDAVTFTNLANASALGNLFIVYRLDIPDGAEIKISNERHAAYKWADPEEIPNLMMDEASSMVLQIERNRSMVDKVLQEKEEKGNLTAATVATIYTDGGSRGNPGPSALGYYIIDQDGKEIKRGGEFLGMSNSRLAEYYGLKEGIEQAIELGLKTVHFKSDCLMMVNQMNGVYQVKNRDLMQVHNDVLKLLEKLDAFSFEHVPRDLNREADGEVNRIIDENIRRGEYYEY